MIYECMLMVMAGVNAYGFRKSLPYGAGANAITALFLLMGMLGRV